MADSRALNVGVPVVRCAKRTVYIVDRDAAVRDSLTVLLEAEGYRTCAFASYQAFSEGCEIATISCLLLDLQLPRHGGDEALANFTAAVRRLPVIVMSGAGSRGRRFVLRHGAAAFVEKPFDSNELVRTLRVILG